MTTSTEQIGRWQKGMRSPNPNGRPKGTLNRYQKFQTAMAAGDASPLAFLLAIVRRDTDALAALDVPLADVTTELRREAAVQCLPYCHQRLPQNMTVGTFDLNSKEGMATAAALSMLSDDDLNTLNSVFRRAEELKGSLTFEHAPTAETEAD